MTWSESLPEVLTRSDFASMVAREPRSIELMASRGLIADPTHRNRGKFVWEEESAVGWFHTLHEHAVVVPANDLAEEELARYGAYLCPLSSSHVGLARPRLLVMYRPGGQGQVFDVTAVETIHQQVPGTRDTTPATGSIVRNGATLDASRKPWTVFYLSEIGTIERITPVIQQGRYLPVDDARNALTSGHLVVPTLDEAFPARK
ncbi:hypothetical protein AB0I98_38420 [Streptomyces sp. NPDC050211]|uniref:hypothetical protein n=1 Tax=Streptomyces sp. NPDC050211 TaxID=3154932 RepID=UPI003428DBC3